MLAGAVHPPPGANAFELRPLFAPGFASDAITDFNGRAPTLSANAFVGDRILSITEDL